MATQKMKQRSPDQLETALELLPALFNLIDDEQADHRMLDIVSDAMFSKLFRKRKQGRGGWYKRNECSNAQLLKMLREHVAKGDMIDVMNLAGMIYVRTIVHGKNA